MKFMKEQEHEILQLESGELVLKKYPNAIGEVMLYDGSLRLAISPQIFDKIKPHIIPLLESALDDVTFDAHVKDWLLKGDK